MKLITVITLGLMILLSGSYSLANTTDTASEPASNNEAQFQIDKKLLDEIYHTEKTGVQSETRHKTGVVEVAPRFLYITPVEFNLSNNYYTVPYDTGETKFPMGQVLFSTPLTVLFNQLEFDGEASVGYSFREGVYNVQSKNASSFRDVVSLHWLPITGALKLSYSIPYVSFIKPSVKIGAGIQWFQQSGKLDGMTQSFWVPFYTTGAALTFFDQSQNGESWFGGVTTGLTLNQSFGSQQVVRCWSLDVGAVLLF